MIKYSTGSEIMSNTNLDVWAIQHYPEEAFEAVKNVRKSKKNILFRGCVSSLTLGSQEIKVYFDTVFFSEESDLIMFLMKDGEFTGEDLKNYLKSQAIPCSDILLKTHEEQKTEPEKEIWFARERYVLEDAIQDSLDRGNDTCTYYPLVKGNFEVSCFTKRGEKAPIDGRDIEGVIELEDKIVLLIQQGEARNLCMKDAMSILDLYEINTSIYTQTELPPREKPKQYQKEQ